MIKFIAALFVISILIPSSGYSRDPANKAECISMLKPALHSQCTALFGNDKQEQRKACLENIEAEVKKQCGRFFSGDDFCSVCTSECINQYMASDPKRKQCLQTCLGNPACK